MGADLPVRPLIGLLLRLVYQQYAHDIDAALQKAGDEFFLGSREKGLHGRASGKKVMCGVEIEVRGCGSGRLRLVVLENDSWCSLGELVSTKMAMGVVVHKDDWVG